MPARSLWPQISADLLHCLGLGLAAGLFRLLGPYRRRGTTVLADFFCTGVCLAFLQSYAAGFSQAGVLRWYMGAAAFAGAWAAEQLLGPARRKAGRLAAKHLQKKRKTAANRRKSFSRNGKREKKQLPKPNRLLYNSNI